MDIIYTNRQYLKQSWVCFLFRILFQSKCWMDVWASCVKWPESKKSLGLIRERPPPTFCINFQCESGASRFMPGKSHAKSRAMFVAQLVEQSIVTSNWFFKWAIRGLLFCLSPFFSNNNLLPNKLLASAGFKLGSSDKRRAHWPLDHT